KGLAKDVERIDDFPILLRLLDEDREFKRHYRKEGGFVVTDFTILDDVLKEIDEKLKNNPDPKKVIFVEFARNNYSSALKNFSREILDRSLILYIYCPYDLCVARNVRRFKEGKSIDDHIAPSDIMEKYYKEDEYEELFLKSEEKLKKAAPARLAVVRNDVDDLSRLDRELENVIEKYF
ncbi:MAG: hypothetical protein QXT22_06020, partial [Candidatus Hadarchaeales archaeon]